METLKVSSKSDPNRVAGALANVLRDKGSAEIQSIGAGALNQAIKAVAIARGFVAPSGKNLVCIPAFTDIVIDAAAIGKCKEIIRNAAIPSAVIFPSESKRETICCGNSWKSSVPMLIIIAVTQSVIFHAFLNLRLFLAP